MEEYKQAYKKQQRQFSKAKKEFLKYFPKDREEVLEIEPEEPIIEIESIIEKPKRERKLTAREQQMNRPIFNSNGEKYEWLLTHGCTNPDDREWIKKFIRSDEYLNLYGD